MRLLFSHCFQRQTLQREIQGVDVYLQTVGSGVYTALGDCAALGRTLELGPLGPPDLIHILGDEQPNRVTLTVMIAILMDMSVHERQALMITYPFLQMREPKLRKVAYLVQGHADLPDQRPHS